MKRKILKKWFAVAICVAMLCSLMSVGASADNGLEIWADEDVIYIPLAAVYYPVCDTIPDGVTQEDLIFSFSNEEIVKALDYGYVTVYQMIAPGETEMTVKTPDGAYSDTVKIVVNPAIPMTSDSAKVYTNIRYQARTFSYVPEKSGSYEISLVFEEDTTNYIEVFDAAFETVGYITGGETVNLDADQTYYICPITDSDPMGDVYELQVTYAGAAKEDPVPTSMKFAQSYMAVSLYDVGALPKLISQPGGEEVYDEVEFTVADESILTVDADARNVSPLKVGYTTVTAKCVSNGWTASVVVEVIDELYFLTEESDFDYTIESADGVARFFRAPSTGTYVFYSVTKQGDPVCIVYDIESGEEIAYGDDTETGIDFAITVDLEKDQLVMLWLCGYDEMNIFEVHYGRPTAATGVELVLPAGLVIAQNDDTVFMESDQMFTVSANLLGGPTAAEEDYEITVAEDGITADEYGYYTLEAGQTATFTVTTENGLTDTVKVKAIKRLAGDINVDGEVDLSDAMMLFYAVNGKEVTSTREKGAMEITGDNRITLADAARVFYYVNDLVETV